MTPSKKLLDLFEGERVTHSKTLVTELQQGMTAGFDEKAKHSMFRAAHSLKGAARLVSNAAIERTAHALESLIQEIVPNSDDRSFIPQFIESLKLLGAGQQLIEVGIASSSLGSSEPSPQSMSDDQISHLLFLASEVCAIAGNMDRQLVGKSDPHVERLLAVATKLKDSTSRLQLVPLEEVVRPLTSIVGHLAEQLQKQVTIKVRNVRTLMERSIVKRLDPCFVQLIRNAIDHGIESPEERIKKGKSATGTVTIDAYQRGVETEIHVRDDGLGIDEAIIRTAIVRKGLHDEATVNRLTREEVMEFLFLPEFSSRSELSLISGRGIGLDIVRDTLRSLGGDVTVQSKLHEGTKFILTFPTRVASIRSIIFVAGTTTVAVPMTYVDRILHLDELNFLTVNGLPALSYMDKEIPYYEGKKVFNAGGSAPERISTTGRGAVIVISHSGKTIAIKVDRVCSEEELIIQPLDPRFNDTEELLGVAIGRDQSVIGIINVHELIFGRNLVVTETHTIAENHTTQAPTVLIIDDSVTVRELEKRLLSRAGFICETAADGKEGFEILQTQKFDIVITDIDMPRMTGFDLLEALQKNNRQLPAPFLVVSYKERIEDRERGIALGASGYLSKGSFKDATFIKTVEEVLKNYQPRGNA